MIYVEQDFYSNFSNAVISSDDETIKTMVVDELSNIVAKRDVELFKLLDKTGVNVPQNASNEEIADVLVFGLSESPKMRVGVSYLIAKQNGILASSQKPKPSESETGEEGEEGDGKPEIAPADSADAVAFVSRNIDLMVQSLDRSSLAELANKVKEQANNKAPNYSYVSINKSQQESGVQEQPSNKKSNKKLWIGVGVVAALVLGYWAYKKGYFDKLLKKGGDGASASGAGELAEGAGEAASGMADSFS